METPEQDDKTLAEQSAFAGDQPPHVPEDGVDPPGDEALDTDELADGGPAGA